MTSRGIFPRAGRLLCAATLIAAPVFAQEALAPLAATSATHAEPPPAPDPAAALPVPAPPAAAAATPAIAPAPVMPAATPVPAESAYAVTLPAERSADIQAHWASRREYVRDRDERRADDEEQRVRSLKDELAIENLFSIGAALVRESIDARAADAPAVAVQRCNLAVELAPALPEAHTCLARALLAENPSALAPAFAQLVLAAGAALRDPRVSRSMLANVLGVLFAGLLLAGLAFVALLFVRYARLYAHDVHHLFPGKPRRWQSRMLAAVLLLLPLLATMGPVPLLFTALFACALYMGTAELVVSLALLGALAAAPLAAQAIGRVAAYGGAAMDVWLVEHGEGTGPEIARLQQKAGAPDDPAISFALARKAKRDGELGAAEKLYLRALEGQGDVPGAQAALRNNLGNVYLLQGETAKAVVQYRQAVDLHEGLAAPHFNLARALAMGGVEGLEKAQAEQARAVELDRAAVDDFTGGSLQANRKSNKFVMDVPLDDAQLAPLREAEEQVATPVPDEVRAMLAGGMPAPFAAGLPLFAAALLLALHLCRRRLRPSSRCDRCGREVCKRCDPEARPAEALCAQCVNVFIRRTGVDAAVRVRKELAVQAYQRRRQLVSRLLALLSGAGHVLLGYPVRGILFLAVTGSLAASVALWSGLAHHPIAVRSDISFARVGLSAALFIAVYAFCIRDLLARQRAEEGV